MKKGKKINKYIDGEKEAEQSKKKKTNACVCWKSMPAAE